MPDLDLSKDEKILNAQWNPLADYKAQVSHKSKVRNKRFGETSLIHDILEDFRKTPPNKKIYFRDDVGNFEHSKLITGIDNRNTIMSLQPNSQKLFLWILFELDYRMETVEIHPDKIEKLGFIMALGTFRNSIKDLCQKNIIRRVSNKVKTKDYWTFYINPQIMWKGDSKRYYKDVLSVYPHYSSANDQ